MQGDEEVKYENGRDLFPEPLLKEIQRYASGKLVYIPSGEAKRGWGESSGYKQYLAERNRTIRERFQAGEEIGRLAEEFYLSYESIRKIVYTKREAIGMEYKCALSSAQEFAKQGKLEEWVHAYLLSDGNNQPFSDGLKQFDRFFLGPIKMPLALFHRCCGPEEGMKWRVHPGWFEKHVAELMEAIRREPDMPPLIVHYLINEQGEPEFELNDGNHRFEAYSRLGIKEYYVIVWITEKAEYERFMAEYVS